MGNIRILFLVFFVLLLQACAVHQLQNKIEGPERDPVPCEISYAVTVFSGSYNNTLGARATDDKRKMELTAKYIDATEQVLKDRGCNFRQVAQPIDASLRVQVSRVPYTSALPQEWLTGLSLGLIPSWGTRKSEYIYNFTFEPEDRKRRYTVDTFSVGHLLLLPFGFFTPDEYSVYREALGNFLTHL